MNKIFRDAMKKADEEEKAGLITKMDALRIRAALSVKDAALSDPYHRTVAPMSEEQAKEYVRKLFQKGERA